MQPLSLRFADVAKAIANATRAAGSEPPTFRSPPRSPGRDRTIRRRPVGGSVVSIRLTGRPFVAVEADMIEGVVAANGLRGVEADELRRRLWIAVEGRDDTGSGADPVVRAA